MSQSQSMSSRHPLSAQIAAKLSSLSELGSPPESHTHRRRFIGPLPEEHFEASISAGTQFHRSWLSLLHRGRNLDEQGSDSESEHEARVRDAIRNHALQFFLGRGGRSEDWGDNTERHVREEMWRLWRESEWGRARAKHKQAKPQLNNRHWVGSSFDVGTFLGVDLLQNTSSANLDPPSSSRDGGTQVPASTAAAETFVTAPSFLTGGAHPPPRQVENSRFQSKPSDESDDEPRTQRGSALSSEPLLGVEESSTPSTQSRDMRSEVARDPVAHMLDVPGSSQRDEGAEAVPAPSKKGKGKKVHYENETSPAPSPARSPRTDDCPASPADVLARTGTEVSGTSAGAAEQVTRENQVQWGDTILRDRMLVRASHTELESISPHFDESEDRVTAHVVHHNWKEFIVVWRKNHIELYRNHAFYGQEWLVGHKHLEFVIPLDSSAIRLSLYSFVDLTFCLVCPASAQQKQSKRHWLLHGSPGTCIFLFKVKSRTRAADWVWHLWHHLGGKLPDSLKISAPFVDVRFTFDIPRHDSGDISQAYSACTRGNIISLCEARLRHIPSYKALMQENQEKGVHLELAWRMDTYLDWIWQVSDVEGNYRHWAVLSGLTYKHAKTSAQLELRIHRHRPNRVHLKDGTRLDEPAAVEGYLDRIRPNTSFKRALYLATHDSWLFSIPPAHAQPPTPPGTQRRQYASMSGETPTLLSPHEAEVRRGRRQIMRATHVIDLRSIVAVRRAFQMVPVHNENVNQEHVESDDTPAFWAQVERNELDEGDTGGEDGLAKTVDKAALRMRRSFELLLSSGRVVRYETHSCADALEWITRLRPLISYWRKRHRVDARLEMDLAYQSGRPRITPPMPVHAEEESVENLPPSDSSLPELSAFYNWCVIDGCRPILKCGRVFWRQGRRGQYKHLQLVLVSGHLVQFRITGEPHLQHHKHLIVNLADAYVVSGYLAAQHFPRGEYHPDNPPLPRRYRDGLESDEKDEDTLFMIWYRKNVPSEEVVHSPHHAVPKESNIQMPKDVPALNAKRKLGVFRTRSKLERDAWVWAINVEIDKTVRRTKAREKRIRETGELKKL